jgi:D-sedoheptulose 7-phosphate isomerase
MSSAPTFTDTYRENLLHTIENIDAAKVTEAISWIREARANGKAIFVAGNGGSAATASHFVCDMLKGASLGKPTRFRIQALHDNMPTLTAYANDLHYQDSAVEQLKNFATPGDIYMAISGSGNSPNVIRALDYAKSIGMKTLVLTGRDGGKLGPLADLEIRVPEQHMGRIEDAHHIICHMICYNFMDTE